MTSVNITTIMDAIETTLAGASGLTYTASYDELREGINDVPLLQIWAERGEQDASYETDRTTFAGGVRQTTFTVNCDLFVKQRVDIAEDMAAVYPLLDAIVDVLEQQDTKPYFGETGIQAFHWSWDVVMWEYGGAELVGARLQIIVRVF